MGFWRRVEPKGAKLRRAGLSTSPLCRNSGSWSDHPRGAAVTYVTCCHSLLHRLVSALIVNCIKYVSCPIKHVASTPMSCPVPVMSFCCFRYSSWRLVIRGPATHGETFNISLNRVAIKEEEVRGVLLCVQDFGRSPHFTPRSFFSESGLTTLSESVATADSITSSPLNAPWSVVQSACASQVITDLCACWDWVVLR